MQILYPHTTMWLCLFFFQAEDGIRGPLWSRGLGDVYKRQPVFVLLERGSAPSRKIGVRLSRPSAEELCRATEAAAHAQQ